MSAPRDLVIVGAGPAGMAAAIQARALGLTVTLLDQQPQPGGQIYRAVEQVSRTRPADLDRLGDGYRHGLDLVRAFNECGAEYLPGCGVWRVEPGTGVWFNDGRRAGHLPSPQVLVACGAMERAVPLPGWTLPGVMGAGAAQILLKTAALVPDGPVVLAGAGPLLLLVAAQLSDAGARVAAVLECTRPRDYLRAAPWLPLALRAGHYLREGMALRRRLHDAGIRVFPGVSGIRIAGDGHVEQVHFLDGAGEQRLDASTVLLHDGVAPHVQLTREAGCEHRWHRQQAYWHPRRDDWGATSRDGLHVAGDCGGVLGARVAESQGRLAALDVARRRGRLSTGERDVAGLAIRGEAAHHGAVRPMLDRLFPPSLAAGAATGDEVVICRCEEITAGQIRNAVRLGARGANQLKAYTRCGMGPCQGRVCQPGAAAIIAAELGVAQERVETMRVRAPVLPVTLGELATLDDTP